MAPLVLVIIYGSVASFVLSPFTVLHIWVVKGLNGVLRLLNDSMQWVGDLPVSHSGDIHLSLLQVGILYCIIVCGIILSVISFTEIVDYCFVWNQSFYRIFRLSILYERGVFSVNPGPFASKSFPSKRCLATG